MSNKITRNVKMLVRVFYLTDFLKAIINKTNTKMFMQWYRNFYGV